MATATILAFVAASLCRAQSFSWDPQKAQTVPNQPLGKANLSQAAKEEVAAALANEIRQQDDRVSEKDLHDAALETRVLITDLNRDGQPEIIAQGSVGCSPTGNCPLWVFRRVNGAYKLLLDGVGQTFTLQQRYTSGFRDIVVAMHGSAFDSMLTVYRYQNGSYHDRECYIASWLARGDPSRQLEQPRIFPCGSE